MTPPLRTPSNPPHRIFTVANFISVARLFLLVPLFMFLRLGREENGNFWAMVVMGIALLTDMLDGLIARVFKQESDWGRLLDPVADKIWIGCLALFLALPWREHPLPWGFLVLLLVRDVAIVSGGIYVYHRTGIILKANWLGKLTMGVEALTLIVFTVYWVPPVAPWFTPKSLMWTAVVLIFASGIAYAARTRSLLRSPSTRNVSLSPDS